MVTSFAEQGGSFVKAEANPKDFKQPQSLAELLALKPGQLERVDIALMNLLCAEGLRGSESLNVQSSLDRLDAWAFHVQEETKRNFHHFEETPQEFNNSIAYYRMGMLGTILAEDLKIQYEPDREKEQLNTQPSNRSVDFWNDFFTDSRNVFVNGLLWDKHYGTCSSMPFLYVAIARRLGYPMNLAATKNHLYGRYEEENGKHLNIEATENRGFATPSDEEYKNGPAPATDEEIKGCGWLRPLSNQEILGICLLTRSGVLRSAKRYEEEVAALDQAARYLPDTPLMKRVLEKNRRLAVNLHSADRWDSLWNELEKLSLPTSGLKFGHFQNQRLQIQFSTNQSTNLAQIETEIKNLKEELMQYVCSLADDRTKLTEAFGKPPPPANQQIFLSVLGDANQTRHVMIRREEVPPEYYLNGIPPALINRLQKLTTKRDMIVEMYTYYAEGGQLRDLVPDEKRKQIPYPFAPTPGPASAVNLHPEDLPMPWRGQPVPQELTDRLAVLGTVTEESIRHGAAKSVIDRFFIDQDQRRLSREAVQARRTELDQEPLLQGPLQIEFLPSLLDGGSINAAVSGANLPLTTSPQTPIKQPIHGKEK